MPEPLTPLSKETALQFLKEDKVKMPGLPADHPMLELLASDPIQMAKTLIRQKERIDELEKRLGELEEYLFSQGVLSINSYPPFSGTTDPKAPYET